MIILDSDDLIIRFKSVISKYMLEENDVLNLIKQATDAAINALEMCENAKDYKEVNLHFTAPNLGLLDAKGFLNRNKLTPNGMTVVTEFNILFLGIYSLLKSLSTKLVEDKILEMKLFPYYFSKVKKDSIVLTRMH